MKNDVEGTVSKAKTQAIIYYNNISFSSSSILLHHTHEDNAGFA